MHRNKSSNRHACEHKELGMPNAKRVKRLSANGQQVGTLWDTSESSEPIEPNELRSCSFGD
jgi:hypothetical protein